MRKYYCLRPTLFFTCIALFAILVGCGPDSGEQPEKSFAAKDGAEETATQVALDENGFLINERFERSIIDGSMWRVTSQNDFSEKVIDVYDVDPSEKADQRLRLRAGTIGTSDETVKFLGIRSLGEFDFTEQRQISFDLDWNDQVNGSYLTAGVYLCPVATDENPRDALNWLAFEYVGVPPGTNARFQISRRTNGNLGFLFTEGWPEQQRTGRQIGNQHVELTIGGASIEVTENGRNIFTMDKNLMDFTEAYLYLQVSSHSNYPSREIYFDNIVVK